MSDQFSSIAQEKKNTIVLLVTVTKVETQAVLTAAEKASGSKPKTQYKENKTYYELGTIGGSQIYLVRSEMGSGGPAGSLSTVQEGIKNICPNYVILVGIAFGVDETKQKIGDILVSQHLQEYELQKVGTNVKKQIKLIPRGERVPCSPLLLDRFRDAELSWDTSKVHFGLVLSGLKLIDNVEFRNNLLDLWPETIGGEMEGTGFYSAAYLAKVDWILVKAICDWADKKGENKEQRQLEAATNAADYLVHVLQKGGLKSAPNIPSRSIDNTLIDQEISIAQKKNIILAYANQDVEIAHEIEISLRTYFGEDGIAINSFELDNGTNLTSILIDSMRSENWFVLLASQHSANSKWVSYEARLLTLLSLEKERYNILTIRLDSTKFPNFLDLELNRRKYIAASKNENTWLEKLREIIRTGEKILLEKEEFFVNRGQELDRLEIEVTRQKIIYLTGVPGIGKSSIIKAASRTKFHRDLIQINIRLGHNLGLLARDILAKCNQPQPNKEVSEFEIAELATVALVQRIKQGSMLFINNAQNAMDTEGILRPYFRSFIKLCIDADISFPIMIASSRKTEILPDDDPRTVSIRIQGLSNEFMIMIVRHWLLISQTQKSKIKDEEISDLAEQFEGYPIAARMLGGALVYESPKSLLQSNSVPKFHRRLAEYIVLSILPTLDEVDQLILQSMAIFAAGITTQQLMAMQTFQNYGLKTVQESISKLSGLMLIDQEIDNLILHPTISAYFLDQSIWQKKFPSLAHQLADISWSEVQNLMYKLEQIPKMYRKPDNPKYVNLNKSMLKIVVPAHRLLLATDQAERAEGLPYKLQGHLREMVFIMYQQIKDYKACVEFAIQWLKIEPKDADVRLYLARAYRQLSDYGKANRLLDQLEQDERNFIRAKVFRERGMIAGAKGELQQATQYFRAGRLKRKDGRLYYPQINANLAISLIAEADQMLSEDQDRRRKYAEAVSLFNEAREFIPRFEENYLDTYVNAQLNSGKITEKKALSILEDALEFQFDNPRLPYRVAEILSNDMDRLDDALGYAREAHNLGYRNALLTIAKIQIMKEEFSAAMNTLADFDPESPRDHLVYDVLRARALRNDPDQAREILEKHRDVNNSFVAYARIQTEINAVEKALYSNEINRAKTLLTALKKLEAEFENQYKYPLMIRCKEQIENLEKRIG